MLVQGYILILLVLIGILCNCMINMKRMNNDLAKCMARLNFIAMATVLSNIVFVLAINKEVSCLGFSLFSAWIDWLLLYMFVFAETYPSYTIDMNKLLKYASAVVIVDSMNLILNPILHHEFLLEETILLGQYRIFVVGEMKFFYHFHLIISYVFVIRIIFVLIKKAIATSNFYRRKYTVILASFLIVIVLDALCVVLRLPLNVSIIFYGVLAFSLSYYALNYEPKKLIQQMQTMIMQNLKSGIACFDIQGKCIYANDGIYKMFHLEKNPKILEEYTYQGQRARVCPDEAYAVWHEEHEVDGVVRYYEIERQNIYDDKHIFVGSYFNVTDRTQQQRMYEKEINIANESNRAKSEFLSRVSHDIRTPVNSIFGMNEMILRESRDEKTRKYARHIKDAVSVLINLINDVLDFSKIEAGKMNLVLREYNIADLIEGINNIISIQAVKKGLEYQCEISPELPSKLKGDDVRMEQILLNIIGNAIKYTTKGSVMLKVWGEKTADSKFFLYASVTDTGIGIKQMDIPKLFNAFERLEEMKNHSIQGTGLGLNITSYLLKLMNSKLEVESVFGEGSTFHFRVEQEMIDESPIGDQSAKQIVEEEYHTLFTAPNAKILVVDDNDINRFVFVSLLGNTRIQIDEAASGFECLDMTQKTQYQMIFMDHMMPELDGVETLHKIKDDQNNLCKDVPVIVLTANVVEGAKGMYLKEGFDGYLTKPLEPEDVEQIIYSLLPKEFMEEGRPEE